ncbi:hypothetical protein PtA15_9A179 [Puccinia triticina]|uniref:Uncharacterized protein n=1 Tax=Puccinia triticina TaxID=208348 RepID=A0ABY7CS69_9BASI|nr:uncharacterized protein PtA15_9A179 [Puccinia triticina]WAQ88054.1 hypothetical protein PtA15_9A179 [Puccinia triticina]
MNEAPLREEVNLLSRLIYSNKNQHHSSIWFRRATEVKRWSTKLLAKLQQPPAGFLDQVRLLSCFSQSLRSFILTGFLWIQFEFRLLRAYE